MRNFSPRYTYDREHDQINKYIVNAACAQGKIVDFDDNGVLTVANTYGYFLMDDVTADGPSFEERIAGLHQWEVKVGNPVSILRPKNLSIVRTIHVAQGGGGAAAPAKGQLVDIASGVYVTVAGNAGTKGKIIGLPADTGLTGYYDVEVYC